MLDRTTSHEHAAMRMRGAAMWLVVLGMNVLGWGMFSITILPHHFRYQGLGVGLGVAITAYTLGARHAFDADHISAIDNVTRKLMADGKRPLGTGFFFALGHSTVVFVVGIGIAFAAKAVFGSVVDPHSGYESVGGIVGTALSGAFLYLIAFMNLIVLIGIARVFRRLRDGHFDEAKLEEELASRGFMARYFKGLMRAINHSWQMYFVGILFGIGFDTATEVLLLAATASAALTGLPWYAVLALPLLFSAGMLVFDTADGMFMNVAYGWAFAQPVRKVYYNLVITGLSIAAAFMVGSIELFGLLANKLRLHGSVWNALENVNINTAGFILAVLFCAVWGVAIIVWRAGKFETRWVLDGPGTFVPSNDEDIPAPRSRT